jgi:type II secretory pathway pseudopilin PulG
MNKNKGFVLIEIVIYIALFSIMIGGLMVSAFQLMDATIDNGYRTATQAEMNFVLKKLDWTIIGASNIAINSGVLEITKNSHTYKFEFDFVNKKITLDNEDITTLNVKVETFNFSLIDIMPKGVNINIIIDGQQVNLTKYIRI